MDVRLTAEDGYTAEREYSIASAPGEPLAITVERWWGLEATAYLYIAFVAVPSVLAAVHTGRPQTHQRTRFAPVLFQPIAGDDVAQAVGKIAAGSPLNGKVEVAGPEQFRMDEFFRSALAMRDDPRTVVTDRTRATSEPSLASEPCCRAPTRFSARSATATGRAEPRPGSNTSPKEKR